MMGNLRKTWPFWLGVAGLFLFTLWLFGMLAMLPAQAHHAPSGWSYPWQCCSNRDCRPVECDTLEEIEDGKVRDIENGQTYDRSMVQSSGDSHCHLCTELGKVDGKPICAFIQQGS
jgi:hypothetical protein